MNEPLKILVGRTDNLGDLILSLPALSLLKKNLAGAQVFLLAKRPLLVLLESFLKEENIHPVGLESEEWKNQKWDVFLSLFSKPKEAFHFFRQGVPQRIGNYNHLWSPLFLNRGIRQKKSLGLKSEADYSMELVEVLLKDFGIFDFQQPGPLYLPIEPKEASEAQLAIEASGLVPEEPFYILHPGMAGSALNLTNDQYVEIIKRLSEKSKVLISVGPHQRDQEMWRDLSLSIPDLRKVEGVTLKVLKEVFRKSKAVIAPSTGPLHLAHAVGVPTIGLYSPVRSHHPNRWSPKGGRVKPVILVPQVSCPAQTECWGARCSEFNCFEKQSWAALILKAVNGLT